MEASSQALRKPRALPAGRMDRPEPQQHSGSYDYLVGIRTCKDAMRNTPAQDTKVFYFPAMATVQENLLKTDSA